MSTELPEGKKVTEEKFVPFNIGDKISVKKNKRVGRHCVATKDINEGDLIFIEQPFAFQILREYAAKYCANCCCEIKRLQNYCEECNQVFYCSSECKNSDIYHRLLCTLYKDLPNECDKDISLDLLFFAFKIIVGRNLPRKSKAGEIVTTYENVKDMYSVHKDNEKICSKLRNGMKMIKEQYRIPESEALEVVEKINFNSHGVTDMNGENTIMSICLCPKLSLLNHSCDPNCMYYSFNNQIMVRAMKQIKTGKELTVAYIDLYQHRDLRNEQLLTQKNFNCQCERCQHPSEVDDMMEGVCCRKCGDEGILLSLKHYDNNKKKQKREKRMEALKKELEDCKDEKKKKDIENEISHLEDFKKLEFTHLICKKCQSFYELKAVHEYITDAMSNYTIAISQLGINQKEEGKEPAFNFLKEFTLYDDNEFSIGNNNNSVSSNSAINQNMKYKYPYALHSRHMFVYNLLSYLNNRMRRDKDYIRCYKYIKSILKCIDGFYPSLYLERSNFLEALGEVVFYKCSNAGKLPNKVKKVMIKDGIEAVEECVRVRKILYGDEYISTIKAEETLLELKGLK